MNLLGCLEHSGRINWREANEQGEHLIQGKECDQPEKTWIESTGEEMKNVERNENSPVEIINERFKRLHTNEIDAWKRLRLREEKGWEGRKNKGNLEVEIDEYLEETTPVEIIEKNWSLILRKFKWSYPLEEKHTG